MRLIVPALLVGLVLQPASVFGASSIRFKEVGEKAGIADLGTNAAGVAFTDYDNDGDVDIYVNVGASAPGVQNRLWENDGEGNFTDVSKERGVNYEGALGRGVAWGDFDNDGDSDLVIATMPPSGMPQGHQPATLFKNLLTETGEPNFENIGRAAGLMRAGNEKDAELGGLGNTSGGIMWVDYDNDGLLDISWRSADYHIDHELFKNNGDGTFTQVTSESGISLIGKLLEINSQGNGGWFDFDQDGFVDHLSTTEGDANVLFHNQGDGTFADVTKSRQPPSGLAFLNPGNANGVCLGDIDNDGDIDAYFPLSDQANRMVRNDLKETGAANFSDITLASGTGDKGGARGCTMADFDNDGLIDIYVNNGGLSDTLINDVMTGLPVFVQFYIAWEPANNALFQNNGDGTFTDVTKRSGAEGFGIGSGVAAGDVNNDGFPDIFANNRTYYSAGKPANIEQKNKLFLNRGNDNNWIKVKLVGTRSNRSAYNARVKAVAGDLEQTREIYSGIGYNSLNEQTITFGLGKRDSVDRIEVTWPSGQVQELTDLEPGQTITITEPS